MDRELRNRLWNLVDIHLWRRFRGHAGRAEVARSNFEGLLTAVWHYFLKEPVDQIPRTFDDARAHLRRTFFAAEWHRVYDFLEFLMEHADKYLPSHFSQSCNAVLEAENSAYRVIDHRVSPITSPAELNSIEQALEEAETFPGVRGHLAAALRLLADREEPDYRNSIKESISAVESVCQTIVGDDKATLRAALQTIEREAAIHGALKSSLLKLYGYTSDEGGIRHAMLSDGDSTFTDAKFMLVSCSAFVNYLIGKVADYHITIPDGKDGD